MPHAALKPCSYPGCAVLVPRGYCEKHAREQTREDARMYHRPDIQRLYTSSRWQAIRRMQLSREPWCAECLTKGVYTQATDVDHVQPHRGNRAAFYQGELQSLCHPCHSRKTSGEVLNG